MFLVCVLLDDHWFYLVSHGVVLEKMVASFRGRHDHSPATQHEISWPHVCTSFSSVFGSLLPYPDFFFSLPLEYLLHGVTFTRNLCVTALREEFDRVLHSEISYWNSRQIKFQRKSRERFYFSSNFLATEVSQAGGITRCNFFWKFSRNAVAHKVEIKVSTHNRAFTNFLIRFPFFSQKYSYPSFSHSHSSWLSHLSLPSYSLPIFFHYPFPLFLPSTLLLFLSICSNIHH